MVVLVCSGLNPGIPFVHNGVTSQVMHNTRIYAELNRY